KGTVILTGNGNGWPAATGVDVRTIRSTDQGATWGPVEIQGVAANPSTGNLSHPWGEMDGDRADLFWSDESTVPTTYGHRFSTDGGATGTEGPGSSALVTTLAQADGVKILYTKDLVWVIGQMSSGNPIMAAMPIFEPDMAQSLVVDAFNRTENPLSDGGAWT